MFDPKRSTMTDYSDHSSNIINRSITEPLKQYAHDETVQIPFNQNFITLIKTKLESEILLEKDEKSVNQYLEEHNYFLRASKENHISVLLKKHEDVAIDQPSYPQETPTSYSIMPGVQWNSKVYIDNLNYRYYKHSIYNNKIYLECANQKKRVLFCPGNASISADMNDNSIQMTGKHNHSPQPVDVPKIFLRNSIGLQATQSKSMSKHIKDILSRNSHKSRRCKKLFLRKITDEGKKNVLSSS